ncbi:MAG: hypothetical protein HUU06_05140 [Planctomycetaceae bacterium]|nr:hypothetical protein [Planctomycetota bacterium]NUN52157.1 hypothetical protein [Planctomycetaceae bacterium]
MGHRRLTPIGGIVAGGALLLAGAASAFADESGTAARLLEEIEALRRSQNDLMTKVELQQRRITELEASAAVPQEGGDASLSKQIEDYLKGGMPTKKGSRFKFYGFLRLDAIWDDSMPSNTQTIGWVRSEDPTVPGGVSKNRGDFTMHPRLTRFGFDLDGGKLADLGDAKVTGKLEIDFYNNGLSGQSESRAALRMRHAFLTLGWEKDTLLAGQTTDLIAPLWPIVNPDLVNWGAGNLGDRRAQVRWTRNEKIGNGTLTLAGMAGLTGAQDNQNLDGDGVRDGEASGLPSLQARIGFGAPLDGRTIEMGLWGHRAREKTAADVGSHGDFSSTALGVDLHFPVTAEIYVKGEAYVGRNMDDVRGGIFQGVNAAGQEIAAQGGWLEVGFKASKSLTLAAGFSEDNPDSGDLGVGGRDRNRIWYAAAHWNWDVIETGVDFMHWHTQFKGQKGGLDNRVQAYIAYHF